MLAAEEDEARALLDSLSDAQRREAVFDTRTYGDIVTEQRGQSRPARAGRHRRRDALTEAQRAQLVKLIEVYARTFEPGLAEARMARVREGGIENVRFGWAGATERGKQHYYRVQGPLFLIEYDASQDGGNHIHYGVARLLRRFRARPPAPALRGREGHGTQTLAIAAMTLRPIVHAGLSLALAAILIVLGAGFADRFNLPFMQGWALAHGSVFLLFPLYFLLFYLLLWPLLYARRSGDSSDSARRPSALAVSLFCVALLGIAIPFGVISLVALALALLALRKVNAVPTLGGRGLAWAGLVIGALGFAYHLWLSSMMWRSMTSS